MRVIPHILFQEERFVFELLDHVNRASKSLESSGKNNYIMYR